MAAGLCVKKAPHGQGVVQEETANGHCWRVPTDNSAYMWAQNDGNP